MSGERNSKGLLPGRGAAWLIDARGCDAARLRDRKALAAIFSAAIRDLGLHPLGRAIWRRFPGGGLTGFRLLRESHLSCHTFPESGGICLDLFCCRERPDWPWGEELERRLGAKSVSVKKSSRRYGSPRR